MLHAKELWQDGRLSLRFTLHCGKLIVVVSVNYLDLCYPLNALRSHLGVHKDELMVQLEPHWNNYKE